MSFILDALKKSESDRQRQTGPALFEVKVAPPKARFPGVGAGDRRIAGRQHVDRGLDVAAPFVAQRRNGRDCAGGRRASSRAGGIGTAKLGGPGAITGGRFSRNIGTRPGPWVHVCAGRSIPVRRTETRANPRWPATRAKPAPANPAAAISTPRATEWRNNGTPTPARLTTRATLPAEPRCGNARDGGWHQFGDPGNSSGSANANMSNSGASASPGPGPGSGADAPANPDDYAPATDPGASLFKGHVRRGTESGLMLYQDMAVVQGANLPQLRLDLHVYAAKPQDRFALINMHKLHEGDSLPDGVRVESITPDGVVMSHNGSKFLLPRE